MILNRVLLKHVAGLLSEWDGDRAELAAAVEAYMMVADEAASWPVFLRARHRRIQCCLAVVNLQNHIAHNPAARELVNQLREFAEAALRVERVAPHRSFFEATTAPCRQRRVSAAPPGGRRSGSRHRHGGEGA